MNFDLNNLFEQSKPSSVFQELEEPFKAEEIDKVVKNLPTDKPPA